MPKSVLMNTTQRNKNMNCQMIWNWVWNHPFLFTPAVLYNPGLMWWLLTQIEEYREQCTSMSIKRLYYNILGPTFPQWRCNTAAWAPYNVLVYEVYAFCVIWLFKLYKLPLIYVFGLKGSWLGCPDSRKSPAELNWPYSRDTVYKFSLWKLMWCCTMRGTVLFVWR